MAEVRLENVTKKFGNTIAVNNVSLHIKDKELMVLVGPSGCGKTTLIRLIAGLEAVDEGSIYIGNQLVNDLSPKKRNIAMVFQDYALYPHMSAFANMAFGLENLGYPKDEIRERVNRVAELLGITSLLNRYPRQMSGGQRQRVALGRATVREPKVFLWDEPLSNLDAKLRVQMRVELQKLQRELGTTTIHVTHDQAEAMSMGDRIAVMKDGGVQQVGTPDEVYNRPWNEYVAGFIGSPPMNFINCSLVEKDNKFFLDAADFALPLSSGTASIIRNSARGEELILGIRPEHIYVVDIEQENAIAIKIEAVEPLGSDKFMHFTIGGSHIVARLDPRVEVKPKEEKKIMIDSEKMHVFDRETEQMIM